MSVSERELRELDLPLVAASPEVDDLGEVAEELAAAVLGVLAPLPREFHRIREVRRQQGMTLRRVAYAMKLSQEQLRREEDPATDLPLSRLLDWQRVLDVPLADLLVECEEPLSAPVLQRARLVRLMKTAAAIQEKSDSRSVRRLADTLVQQLVEIMPELKGVTAWHSVGQRRSLEELGRIVERAFPDNFFSRH